MEGEIRVQPVEPPWFFFRPEGKQLLECFRNTSVTQSDDELDQLFLKVLLLIEVEPRVEPKKGETNLSTIKKLWRDDRVRLYNNLLPLALGAEDGDRMTWEEDDKKAKKLWEKGFNKHFVSGSTLKYLLDHIHEKDDIMLKYHHVTNDFKNSLSSTIWLRKSMEMFKVLLVNPIIDKMMEWDGSDEAQRKELLMAAKGEFKNKLSEHGIISSWRYKARVYWMLARSKHAYISGGKASFKSYKYTGPIGFLFQEIITEDGNMLAAGNNEASLRDPNPKAKFAKFGNLKTSSLLAYASAVNDHALVTCILKSREEFVKSPDCDYNWEKDWKKAWADALWNAAYKGHGPIVKELISSCSELYSPEYYSAEEMHPPLHVAVRRGHFSVVDAFCTESKSNLISCHEEDRKFNDGQTPLEIATSNLKDEPPGTKKKIQGILLQRPEVKQAVEESYRQRELTVGSANAIMVGAALIASVTFAGWLQPPLGYHTYYQFTEPVPGAPNAPLSYLFVQGHTAIRVFAIFNSLSFSFAIAAMIAGMETYCYIGDLEETYITKTVQKLRNQLKRTRLSFIASVLFVLIAFSSAAIAILPPINLYQRDIYITIGLGGFICLVYIGRILLSISKRRFYKRTRSQLLVMFRNIKKKFLDILTPSLCCKGLEKIKYYLEEGN